MLTASNWKDYELLDASDGERLERWGEFILRRPDPQVIWHTSRAHEAWDRAHAVYKRSGSGGGAWVKRAVPDSWVIGYNDLKFLIRLTNFKHTGLFPEQAANWEYIIETISKSDRPIRALNLFAYTGAASLAAAYAGAEVCHVDAARGIVSWARENAGLSGLDSKPIRWIVDDCVKFLEREIRRGRQYDVIMMDPPSYGRGPGGEMWKLEDDLWRLVSLAADVLSENPLFVILNSYTTGLSPAVLTYISESIFTKRFGGASISDELGIRVNSSGLILPCGAVMRWER